MRCLVLGGGGFLGGHLISALLEEGHEVRAFDRSAHRARADQPDAEWREGDFGNRGDLLAAVDGCDIAFHLIATTLPRTSNEDPVHDLESNLLPTVRFLDIARDLGLRKVIFASSGGTVYGTPSIVPIPETHPTRPVCSYGIHKLAIEHYLHLYYTLYGLDYGVLRLANPFGERQRTDASQGAVAVFLDKALRGEEAVIWGDGSVVRDYLYVKDAAAAFCAVARHASETKTFNIGSGQGQSLNELLAAIESVLGEPVRRRYQPGRPFDVPVNVLDTSLAADVLGWRPRVSFRDG